MSDLIRRQDAIDALKKIMFTHLFECGEYIGEDTREVSIMNAEKALDVIETLPSAEPERKTGKWVKVSGYFTPGGDPVWKCSECGKGIHVYGIEAPSYNRDYTDGHQWVACPNCGADMRGG